MDGIDGKRRGNWVKVVIIRGNIDISSMSGPQSPLSSPTSPFLPISPHSLYRHRQLKAFSGLIRSKQPISPISKGTAVSSRRLKSVVMLQITAMLQVARPTSHCRRNADNCEARRRLSLGVKHRKTVKPEKREIGVGDCRLFIQQKDDKDYEDSYCTKTVYKQPKKPEKPLPPVRTPWPRERRFLTQAISPHSNDHLSAWCDHL